MSRSIYNGYKTAKFKFFGGDYRTKANFKSQSRVTYGIVKELRLALPKYRTLRIGNCSKTESSFDQVFTKQNLNSFEVMTQQVIHPMVKLQRNVQSLVDSKIIKPTDSIWKIALLYSNEWQHWKQELLDFGFTMQDPVSDLLAVEAWDEG